MVPTKSLILLLAGCFCILLQGACKSDGEHELEGRLSSLPADGMTGLSDLHVDLILSNGTDGLRQGLASRLSLATWPQRETVLSTITLTPGGVGGSVFDTIAVAPQAAVADGWYAVLIQGLPTGASWQNSFYRHSIDADVSSVRVHKGAAPSLWSIDFCPKSNASVQVYLNLTEPVLAASESLYLVSVRAAGQECAETTVAANSRARALYGFLCGGVTLSDVFGVSLMDGLASVTGVAVSPFEQSLTADRLDFGPSGCPAYKISP